MGLRKGKKTATATIAVMVRAREATEVMTVERARRTMYGMGLERNYGKRLCRSFVEMMVKIAKFYENVVKEFNFDYAGD